MSHCTVEHISGEMTAKVVSVCTHSASKGARMLMHQRSMGGSLDAAHTEY